MKNLFVVVLVSAIVFVSCKEKKQAEEQASAPVTEAPAVVVNTPPKMYDTTGLYKITNAEARAYILEMSNTIVKIEDAVNNNAPFNIPELMNEITSLQRRQGTVQSVLSEKDRSLFNIHMDSVATRLDKIVDKMSKL